MSFRSPIPAPEDREWRFPKLPEHVAIILDGNGRWAKSRGMHRVRGHWEGARRVDEITEECARLGISYLTLYAFSTENWNRPRSEISALMRILVHYLKAMEDKLVRNRIALISQGRIEQLPKQARYWVERVTEKTSEYQPRMILDLALSYGGRGELRDAMATIARRARSGEMDPEEITEQTIREHLYQPGVPDPDLLIRTGGDLRISNFLLWQAAYTEFYFTKVLWPDFTATELHNAIRAFAGRERRFGMTSEQVYPEHAQAPL